MCGAKEKMALRGGFFHSGGGDRAKETASQEVSHWGSIAINEKKRGSAMIIHLGPRGKKGR